MPLDAANIGWLITVVVNMPIGLALLTSASNGTLPASAGRPVWTYFRQLPRRWQFAWLLALGVLAYALGLALLAWNMAGVFDAAGQLVRLRFQSAAWLSMSLTGLLPLLYWGWVVPRRAARDGGAVPPAGQPSQLSS
jgi:hypothetical protein